MSEKWKKFLKKTSFDKQNIKKYKVNTDRT